MDKLQALLQALKATGKAGLDIGGAGIKAGKEFSIANPKTASAIGGGLAGGALAKILGRGADDDAEEQEKRMRLMQLYGE